MGAHMFKGPQLSVTHLFIFGPLEIKVNESQIDLLLCILFSANMFVTRKCYKAK